MTICFSELDLSNQKLIAEFVSQAFLRDINRKVAVEEIIRLFNAYKVDVEWTDEESFSLCSNEQLEHAIRQIMTDF